MHRIVLGITSYKDLTGPTMAEAVYDSLARASEKLLPDKITMYSDKLMSPNRQDFISNWLTEIPFKIHAGRTKRTPVMSSGGFRIGIEWSRRSSLRGGGRLQARPETDPCGPDVIEIDYAFSKNVDWSTLFEDLVAATEPSYAMAHVFEAKSRADSSLRLGKDQLEYFEGAIAGEGWFTAWKTPAGDWRGPDSFRIAERRQYRHLPDLPWLNHFGPEFDGQFDDAALKSAAFESHQLKSGLTVQLSRDSKDIADHPEAFRKIQRSAKACFVEGFFRR